MNLTRSQLTFDEPSQRYVTEASDLGLPPGQWPPFLNLIDFPGGSLRCELEGAQYDEGEVVAVGYVSKHTSVRVDILND